MNYQLWAQDRIKNFCEEHSSIYSDYAIKNEISVLLCNNLCESNAINEKISLIFQRQKQINALFLKCMFELKTVFERHRIRYAFLKGLTIAYDLYSPIESRRIKDIDVLIDKILIRGLLSELLLNYGYGNIDGSATDVETVIKHAENGHHHVDPIYKRFSDGDFSAIVRVEIHMFPFEKSFELYGNTWYDNQYARELLDRAEPFTIGNYNVLRPSPCDYILILLMHLCTHLFLDISLYCYVNKPFRRRNIISLTMDIAMFVCKYNERIEWEKVLSYAEKNGVLEPVVSCVEFVNQIYGTIINLPNINVDRHNNSPIQSISRIISDIGIDEYIFSQNIEEIVHQRIINNITLHIEKQQNAYSQEPIEIVQSEEEAIITINNSLCGYVDIVLYSKELRSVSVMTEILLHITETTCTAYLGDIYEEIWSKETWGKLNSHELICAYKLIDIDVVHGKENLEIRTRNQSVIRYLANEYVVADVQLIDEPNPFIGKCRVIGK